MKKLVQKDKHLRNSFVVNENKHTILKSLVKNKNLSKLTRWNASWLLTNFFTQHNPTKFSNRCVVTARKNILNKHFKLSRLSLLKIARKGLIFGLKKSM